MILSALPAKPSSNVGPGVDPAGVALAAIQGLNERLVEKDAEIAALQASHYAMQAELAELAALAALREQMSALLAASPPSR